MPPSSGRNSLTLTWERLEKRSVCSPSSSCCRRWPPYQGCCDCAPSSVSKSRSQPGCDGQNGNSSHRSRAPPLPNERMRKEGRCTGVRRGLQAQRRRRKPRCKQGASHEDTPDPERWGDTPGAPLPLPFQIPAGYLQSEHAVPAESRIPAAPGHQGGKNSQTQNSLGLVREVK